MNILYFPGARQVQAAMQADDPMLVLIALDRGRMLVAPADESMEHLILLKQLGFPEGDLDKYFRVVVNKSGADWTFVCPAGYEGISARERRIEQFYKDGFRVIPPSLKKLGYDVPLEIPKRFRRHIDVLKNGNGFAI